MNEPNSFSTIPSTEQDEFEKLRHTDPVAYWIQLKNNTAPKTRSFPIHSESSVPKPFQSDNTLPTQSHNSDSLSNKSEHVISGSNQNSLLTGQLPTGLTYYIKASEQPRNKAYLRLIVKVGSVHEVSGKENGFAHVLEHMLFRCTRTFTNDQIQNFLASIGAQPGADSNASTHYDHTLYKLMIPLDETTLDLGFTHLNMAIQLLSEIAMRADLNNSAVLDQERGIVLEEFRLATSSRALQFSALATETALFGTPFDHKPPIGDPNIIETCTTQQVDSFYKKWYQLDNMAVIVVGDIKDPQLILDMIQNHFADVPSHVVSGKDFSSELVSELELCTLNTLEALRQEYFPLSYHKSNNNNINTPQKSTILSSTQSPLRQQQNNSLRRSNSSNNNATSGFSSFHFTSAKHSVDSASHLCLIFRYLEPPLQNTFSELKFRHILNVLIWLLHTRANHIVDTHVGRFGDIIPSENRLASSIRIFKIDFTCAPGCELESFGQIYIEIEKLKRYLILKNDLEHIKSIALEMIQNQPLSVGSDILADSFSLKYLYNDITEHTSKTPLVHKRAIESITSEDIHLVANALFDISTSALCVAPPEDQPTQRQHRRRPSNPTYDEQTNNIQLVNGDKFLETAQPTSKFQSSVTITSSTECLNKDDFIHEIRRIEQSKLDPVVYFNFPSDILIDHSRLPPKGQVVSSTSRYGRQWIYQLSNGARIQLNVINTTSAFSSSSDANGLSNNPGNGLGINLEMKAENGLAQFWVAGGIEAFRSALVSSYFAKYISVGDIPLSTASFELGLALVSMDMFLFEHRAIFTCLPSRLETLLKVVHCMFTRHPAPWSTNACDRELSLMADQASASLSPENRLLEKAVQENWSNILIQPLSERDIRSVQVRLAKKAFKEAWSRPEEFLFQFTSNLFADESMRLRTIDLVERYIGSLPRVCNGAELSQRSVHLSQAFDIVASNVQFSKGVKEGLLYGGDEGIAIVLLSFPIPSCKYQNEVNVLKLIPFILRAQLLLVLRSQLARAYDVHVTTKHHFGTLLPGELTIKFSCDPHRAKELAACVLDAISDLQESGPPHRLLESCKSILTKKSTPIQSPYTELSSYNKVDNTSTNASNPPQETLFGKPVPSGHISQFFDHNLSKQIFKLLFPLTNYTQFIMLPSSFQPQQIKNGGWSYSKTIFASVGLGTALVGIISAVKCWSTVKNHISILHNGINSFIEKSTK